MSIPNTLSVPLQLDINYTSIAMVCTIYFIFNL